MIHNEDTMSKNNTRIGQAYVRSAFSLVELSIVIVVIGLLVGGIMVGQGMIQTAKLRTISTDFSMYRSALNSFREKYSALPGDMPNATQFWGPADGVIMDVGVVDDCANLTTAAVGNETCNGNGNGFIAEQSVQYYEAYRGWQQLANAGMIKGKYTGVSGTNRAEWFNRPGVNSPAIALDKRGSWSFRSFSEDYAGDTDWFAVPAGNYLMAGASVTNPVVNMHSGDALFSAGEARMIDGKFDDGIAGSGNIMTFKGGGTLNSGCTNGNAVTDKYRPDRKGLLCTLIFRYVPPQ